MDKSEPEEAIIIIIVVTVNISVLLQWSLKIDALKTRLLLEHSQQWLLSVLFIVVN